MKGLIPTIQDWWQWVDPLRILKATGYYIGAGIFFAGCGITIAGMWIMAMIEGDE